MRKGKKIIAGLLAFGMLVQSVSAAFPMQVKAEETDGGVSDLLFHDFEEESLTDVSASGTLTTEKYHGGTQALAYKRDNGSNYWDVSFAAKDGAVIDFTQYKYITFWVYTAQENTLEVKVFDENNKETHTRTSTKAVANEWTYMSLPVASLNFENVDQTKIAKMGFWDDPDGAVYYIDDIVLTQEVPADESVVYNGTPVLMQDFESGNTSDMFVAAEAETIADIEAGAGCDGSAGLVYQRTTTSAAPSKDAGSVIFKANNPVDVSGLRYLVFYIKDMQGSNNPMIALLDETGKETDFSWTDGGYLKSKKGEWTQFNVPMSTIPGGVDLTKITGVRIGEWNQGTYYIDNVYFTNYLYNGIPGTSDYQEPSVAEKEVKTSVEPGYYTDGRLVELIANKDEFIYYTTDGTEPKCTLACQYTKPISVSKSTVIKAFSGKDGNMGEVYTFDYKIVPYPVTATSKPGTYTDQAVVEFRTKNNNDLIYYTTDGSEPVRGAANTTQYIKPMLVTESTAFKAIAYDSSTGEANEVAELSYTIEKSNALLAPAASKLAGTYGNTVEVELSADGDIYYTTDGSEPTADAVKYEKPITVEKDTTVKAVTVRDGKTSAVASYEYKIDKTVTPFLKADGKVLKDNYGTGDVITLRGTNAGGWLVTEDWQCPTNAKDQLTAQKVFTERFGAETAQELIDLYQDGWWTEADFDLAKAEGMNVLRLPVTYFEMLNEDGSLKQTAFDRMQWFIENCEKRSMYVLIDMHGAVGSQNGKDHSGDVTIPDVGNFYDNEENITKTIQLWEAIAEKYKDNPWVCGYDLLNEPSAVGTTQFEVYDRIYDAIRAIDKNHVLYMQAIWEPTHLPNPEFYGWQNVAYEYHFYGWHVEKDAEGQKEFINSKVKMVNEDTNYDIPLLVGEFTFFSNTESWKAMDIFEEQGWSYTTWTWKVTGDNSSWGMYTSNHAKVDIYNDDLETIRQKWAADKLNTDSAAFKRNDAIADILKTYFAKNVPAKPAPGDKPGNGSGSSQTPSNDGTATPGEDPSQDSSTDSGENQNGTAPAKNDKITAAGGTVYVVTKSANDSSKPTVKYYKPKKSVETVKIPATVKIDGVTYQVTAIAANAFKGDKKITKVTIGENVKTIEAGAFANNKKLKVIVIKSQKLTAKTFEKGFAGIGKNVVIQVPAAKYKVYKKYLRKNGCKAKVKAYS